MASSHSPRALVAVPLALALAACGGDPGPRAAPAAEVAAAASGASSGVRQDTRRGNRKDLPVLSRNLYLGADLGGVIAAPSLPAFVAATTAVWMQVQANDYHARVEALADEIADERPALVGLQEAYLWRIQSPGDALGARTPATEVVYDYVGELVAALRARGLEYRVAAQVTLFDFEAPIATGEDVRMTDHGVVLARADVETANGAGHVFATLLPLTVAGTPVQVARGWAEVDVRVRDTWVRFVSTHLEAFHPGVRMAQAAQLAALLQGEARPVVLVGDLNSEPGTEGAAILAAAGFRDAWAELEPDSAGLTCCFAEDLSEPAELRTRIDYVLFRGALEAHDVEVLGDAAQVAGLWPSDHAGVFAELRLAPPRRSGPGPSR